MESDQPKLVIIGGDPVIGGALEMLLQGAGYRVRLILSPDVDLLDDLLADYQVLLVAPDLRYEYRKTFLNAMVDSGAVAKVPVLELVSTDRERAGEREWVIPWPCRVEDLKRAVDGAMLAGR